MTATEPTPAAAPCSGPKALPNDRRHFDSVTIRRFRGLEDLELGGLGAFNLFVGANDVGKTSVLEAIFLLCATHPMALVRMQNHRLLAVSGFDDLAMAFHGLNVDENIELTAKLCAELRKISISSAYVWTSEQSALTPAETRAAQTEIGTIADISTTFGIDAEQTIQWAAELSDNTDGAPLSLTTQFRFLDDEIKSDSGIPLPDAKKIADRMHIPSIFVGTRCDPKPIADIITQKRKSELLASLKGVDPQIQDIAVKGDIVYLDIGLDKMIPMNMFGNGVGRAVTIVAQCILRNVRSIMVDEIENGLHYTAIRQVLGSILRLAVFRGIQVYATAHSIDVLTCLREILLEDEFTAYRSMIACYVLARDWKGRVRSYRYGYEQFDHCIKHGIEIR